MMGGSCASCAGRCAYQKPHPTGNLTDDGETCLFTYDYRNRIIEVKRKSHSALRAVYEYNGTNRRIRKITYTGDEGEETEATDTWFTYDTWQLIEERDHNDSNELRARYIYGGRYLDELIREDRDNTGDGDFADEGDYNLYACQDTQYNVVALTELDGDRLERAWYEPYGKATVRSEGGSEQATSFFDNPCLFQGQRFDVESGTYYFRNRQYSATFGRFLQRDPVGYKDGMSLYCAYFAPFGFDPMGLDRIEVPDDDTKKDELDGAVMGAHGKGARKSTEPRHRHGEKQKNRPKWEKKRQKPDWKEKPPKKKPKKEKPSRPKRKRRGRPQEPERVPRFEPLFSPDEFWEAIRDGLRPPARPPIYVPEPNPLGDVAKGIGYLIRGTGRGIAKAWNYVFSDE